jgi:hypothetical protein
MSAIHASAIVQEGSVSRGAASRRGPR